MEIIPYIGPQVKNSVGGFTPAEEDTALLESNRSASVGPKGVSPPALDVPFCDTDVLFCDTTPLGLNAKNSPAATVSPNKAVDSTNLDVSPGSYPALVGLSNSLVVNGDRFSIQNVKEKFLRHKYKLAHSPGVFLHLRKKTGNSEALYHTGAAAQSRYFPEGRAYIQERLRERLGTQRQAGVFLTLTVSASDYEIQNAWSMIWRPGYRQFRQALNVYRKRHMGARGSLIYLAVLEQCKSGYPHMHVFFPGLRWLIKRQDLGKMEQWWKMGNVRTEKEHPSESAQSYVMKYISKLDGWSDTSMALLWHFHLRLYNLSHSVYLARPEPEWEVIGRYAGAEEMGKGLEITVEEAESIIDGGGRFIPLGNGSK